MGQMAAPIRFFELNTGAKLPSVALGTYAVVRATIEQAIKVLRVSLRKSNLELLLSFDYKTSL